MDDLVAQLEESLATAKAVNLARFHPPEGWVQAGWVDAHGNLWALGMRNGAVTTDRPVFAPPALEGDRA